MARTETNPIALGFQAPDFSLPDTISGQIVAFREVKGKKGTVVMFICNHCPFVVHVIEQIVSLASEYQTKGFGFVAISSNDVENYPQDDPVRMKEFAAHYEFPFPYLYDESQKVARAYDAACTPDFSIFDSEDNCVYRGELDGSRPGNGVPVAGESLRMTLDILANGEKVPADGQRPSVGCGIKWKS